MPPATPPRRISTSASLAKSTIGPSSPITPTDKEEEWETYHPSLDSEDDLSVSTSRSPGRARRRIRVGSSAELVSRRNTPVKKKKPVLKASDTTTGSTAISPRRAKTASPPTSPRPNHNSWYQTRTINILVQTFLGTFRTVSFFLSILISPLISLLTPILLPIALTISAALLAGLGAYILLPRLPSFLVSVTASFIRNFLPIANWASGLTDMAILRSAALGPARVLVTPICALMGVGCEYSLLSTLSGKVIDPEYSEEEGEVRLAKPFWQWNYHSISFGGRGERDGVDVGKIARGLSREVVQARDVFESVQSLGAAGLVDSLHYVKIWELATAVGVGGNFPEKTIVGQELAELGDLTRDLSDEITAIDHAAVSAFTWIQWEFTTLLELFDSPTPPTNLTLSRRLDSLISQLDTAFTSLHTLTSSATQTAGLASQKGRSAVDRIEWIKHQIQVERDEHPIWKHAWDKNKHRLIGGIVPRSEMLQRDLSLTTETIQNLHEAKIHLERVRILTQGYRDQIGMTKARMVGYHIGAEGAGVEAEEEVRVLERLVGGLKGAVEGAKRRDKPKGGGYREIGS